MTNTASSPGEITRNAQTSRGPDGTVEIAIGGVEVHVRVNKDGLLYVWVEVDNTDAVLLDVGTGCLPIRMGVIDATVFETDAHGVEITR